MEERTQEELEWYLERFIGSIQQCLEEHENTRAYGDNWTVTTKKGPKYWKIIATATPKDENAWLGTAPRPSIFGFVRRKDGAILMNAGKRPQTETKSAVRGYIWEETANSTFSWTGINYDMGS